MRLAAALPLLAVAVAGCSSMEERRAAAQANPAPCPNVFVLGDAARFIEFAGEEETLDAVAFSGEIDDVTTSCRYYADVPIEASVDIAFSIGRGPAAEAATYDVTYFVAVTRTNRDVIAKELFQVPVTFREGQRVVSVTQSINDIVIPRAGEQTSGTNFEIAVGFALDRDQVLYNRSGKSLKFPEA